MNEQGLGFRGMLVALRLVKAVRFEAREFCQGLDERLRVIDEQLNLPAVVQDVEAGHCVGLLLCFA